LGDKIIRDGLKYDPLIDQNTAVLEIVLYTSAVREGLKNKEIKSDDNIGKWIIANQ
jgi:hypothetical protein